MRSIPTALALFLLAVPAHGGIAYKMHAQAAQGNVVWAVVADRVKKPKVSFAEEPSEDVIAGMATRKFVLNASY